MPDSPARSGPPPLVVAASLAALEGSALVVAAIVELATISSGHPSLNIALAVFFAAYGALLIGGGVGLYHVSPWPRGPVLISQLILLGLAWGLRDEPAAAVAAAIVGVVTIGGIVHPASIEALEQARENARDQASGSKD